MHASRIKWQIWIALSGWVHPLWRRSEDDAAVRWSECSRSLHACRFGAPRGFACEKVCDLTKGIEDEEATVNIGCCCVCSTGCRGSASTRNSGWGGSGSCQRWRKRHKGPCHRVSFATFPYGFDACIYMQISSATSLPSSLFSSILGQVRL